MKKLYFWPAVLGSTVALLICIATGTKHLGWPIGFFVFTILFWLGHELYKKFSKKKCPFCDGSGRIYQTTADRLKDRKNECYLKSECYLCHGKGKI
jgi:hypothetical protein